MLDLDDIAEVVAGAVREATGPLLARIDALERRELALPEKGDPGEQGEKGDPGEVDMGAVKALIEAAVAVLPPAERGEKGEPGQDGLPGEKGVDGLPGEPGKDGVGLADALIDKDGHLVLTMTDGRTKSLCQVVGKDGDPGKDGETFTLDDFDIEPLDERTIKLGFTRGDTMHSFELAFPVMIYRNVWREGETYGRGDTVTWGGNLYHCDKDGNTDKPDAKEGWTLCLRRGRDGKDAGK